MSKRTTPPAMLGAAEACEQLGIDRSTLTRWVRAGMLVPVHKMPGATGAYLFTPDEVKRVIAARAAREPA